MWRDPKAAKFRFAKLLRVLKVVVSGTGSVNPVDFLYKRLLGRSFEKSNFSIITSITLALTAKRQITLRWRRVNINQMDISQP